MKRSRFAVAALAAMAISCRSTESRDDVALCVPSDTVVLAGLNLSEIRSSPLYGKLAGFTQAVESFREATHLLLAFNGKDLLMIAQGPFRAAPAGWTLVEPSLAVSGSDAAVRVAVEQHKHGAGALSRPLSDARSIAGGKPIWIAAPGGVALPLTGNARNLNRLLRDSEFAAITLALSTPIRIEIGRASCRERV